MAQTFTPAGDTYQRMVVRPGGIGVVAAIVFASGSMRRAPRQRPVRHGGRARAADSHFGMKEERLNRRRCSVGRGVKGRGRGWFPPPDEVIRRGRANGGRCGLLGSQAHRPGSDPNRRSDAAASRQGLSVEEATK